MATSLFFTCPSSPPSILLSPSSSSHGTSFVASPLRLPISLPKRCPRILSPPRAAVDASKVESLGSELKSLTLAEARSLVDWLQAELGVSAAAFAPSAAPVAGGVAAAEAAPAVEEKTEFDVVLEEVPSCLLVSRSLKLSGLSQPSG